MLHVGAGLLGPAGVALNLFIPLSAAYVGMRAGFPYGGGVVALVAVGLAGLGGFAAAAGYLLQFGLGSLLLPLLLRRGMSWDRAVGLTLAVVVGAAAVTLVGYASYRSMGINEIVARYVQGEIDRSLVIYREADLAPEQYEELRMFAERMAEFLGQAYPGLAIVVTGILLLFTVLFLARLANGRYVLPGPPFSNWKAPELLIWAFILAGFGVFLADGWLWGAALNLLTILVPVYFLQGLAVATFFFRKKGISPGFRTLGYVLVLLLNPLPLIVTGVGVFDLWADFRKPRIKKT